MLDQTALRRAIDALEETVARAAGRPANVPLLLGRLYATYAQAVLERHGVPVDLMAVCGDSWSSPHTRR